MDSAATYEKRDPGSRYPVKHCQHINFQVACEAQKSTLLHRVGTSFNLWVTKLRLKQDCLIFCQTQQNSLYLEEIEEQNEIGDLLITTLNIPRVKQHK